MKMIVIMNKGEVYDKMYFENEHIARNYIKWKHPKKHWKELPPNMLKCKYTGMVMRFEEINSYKGQIHSELESKLQDNEPVFEKPMFNADNYDRLLYLKDH